MGSSSSSKTTLPLRIMLTSLIVLTTATILNMFILPSILTFAVNDIPILYSTILSWLRPPYLYVIINTIIITIAATSRFHHNKVHSQSQPLLDHHLPPVITVPPMAVYEPEPEVLYEVEKVVVDDKEVAVVNEGEDIYEVQRSTWQSPVEKVQTEFVFPVKEKPLASSRFAGQRKLTAKFNPEGARPLRVSKSKKHETLESTWRKITDGRHMPLNRHLKKSDTFENQSHQLPPLDHNAMKKLETFNERRVDRVVASGKLRREGSLRKEGSPSQDELNRRVEAFIKKFNDEMRLQRQESLQRYTDMMNRGAE